MTFIICDTEYTSWEGCQKNGWKGNQKKEIVQISALKVSNNLAVLAEFNVLCKPVINPVLSEYFINLTHVTNEQIKKQGISFAEAYQKLENFIGNNICYSHGWGTDYLNKSDGDILEENLRLYKIKEQKNIIYRNIAPVFKQLYAENKISVQTQCAGQIAEILGLDEKLKKSGLKPHNAMYDVYSILAGLKYFYPKSVKLLNGFEQKANG